MTDVEVIAGSIAKRPWISIVRPGVPDLAEIYLPGFGGTYSNAIIRLQRNYILVSAYDRWTLQAAEECGIVLVGGNRRIEWNEFDRVLAVMERAAAYSVHSIEKAC